MGQTWRMQTKSSSPPATLYSQVAARIEKLIRSGALRPGDRIPSIRLTCTQHGVSLTTAVQAYLYLENQGLIEARPKSGFFVRSPLWNKVLEPALSRVRPSATSVGVGSLQSQIFDSVRNPELVPLGAAYPGVENLPVKKLGRIMSTIARREGERGMSYDMPPGSERLRRQIARRSLDWGGNLSPDEIITTCGGTEALALCLRAVTKPGDVVAVEAPTYFGVLQQIEEMGLKVREIPMHPRDGMNLDVLEQILKKQPIAACIATPNFNNPLGSLMPDDAKQRLVALLAGRKIPLVEDDINGELYHGASRPRAAQAYDQAGMVLLCGSFSKTIAPGYRVGWVAPGRYYDRVKSLKLTSTLATASLPQYAIAEFVANGGYDHHLRTLRRQFARQIQRMSAAVAETFPQGIKLTRPAGGFVLWIELPPKVRARELHQLALAARISIAPGTMFSATQSFPNFIRLNCGHPWSDRIEQAVETLGRLVKQLM